MSMKGFLVKIRNVILLLFIVLLGLEAVLQLGGLFVKETAWRAKAAWATGNVRVLALGDSNTYGLYLPENESYPAQLQSRWNQGHPDKTIEVINLGYPGTNSFRLLENLGQALDTFSPEVVLLMIGFNDFWTPEENPHQYNDDNWIDYLKSKSRLYKLVFMLVRKQGMQSQIDTGVRQADLEEQHLFTQEERLFLEKNFELPFEDILVLLGRYEQSPQSFSQQEKQHFEEVYKKFMTWRQEHKTEEQHLNAVKVGEQTFSLGIRQGEPARHSKYLESNLLRMLAMLEEREIPVILLNYPTRSGYYPAANKKIAAVAEGLPQREGRVFVDLSHIFPDHCAEKPDTCPDLLFYDAHATAKGNAQVAESVAQGLQSLLE